MHRNKRGGGGVKKPVRPPGPLKKVPVFANQVPFRFDPDADTWTEVVLPHVSSNEDGGGGGRINPRTAAHHQRGGGRRGASVPQRGGRRPVAKPTAGGTRVEQGEEQKKEEEKEVKEKEQEERVGGEGNATVGTDVRTDDHAPPRTIKLCTMNILFDMYDDERIHTKRRIPAIIELLRATDADIIGLQEVTQAFLIRLLREEWVKRNYYSSDGPLGYSLKPFYGQLILSKIPFHRLITHQFSKSKKVTIAQFLIEGQKVWMPVVHLTSNRKGSDLYNKRHLQLQSIFEKICPLHEEADERTEIWLMGDFNFEDGEEDRGLPAQWSQFLDVWPTLHPPSEPGYTYDPQRNALAAANSSSGKSRRIDRVMLRSGARGPRWEPCSIELIGTEPLPELETPPEGRAPPVVFPSDHFGLVAVLTTKPGPASSRTTATSDTSERSTEGQTAV